MTSEDIVKVNPLVRHFLPSVVRGVYRFDDGLSDVSDDQGYREFVENKLRFLPLDMRDEFLARSQVETDFRREQRRRTLSAELLESKNVAARRAKAFFRRHRYFDNALSGSRLAGDDRSGEPQNYLEIQFVKKILARLLSEEGLRAVCPQRAVGPYFLDFAIEGVTKLALEVDGFGKFHDRHELDEFTKRQNFITRQGWRVLRYTYGQVMKTHEVTLRELHTLLKSDPQLRDFLTVQAHGDFQCNLFPEAAAQSAIDLVNDFYRTQDCFVDELLTASHFADVVLVRDNFEVTFPFVAASISALYEFLDAVAGIVETEFDLPTVRVAGKQLPDDWSAPFHSLVCIAEDEAEAALTLDSETVRAACASSVLAPPGTAGDVRFRKDLSVDAIQQRLEFFTRSVFGYASGTKPFQNKVLQRIFNGENVLGISATGSGKSFCFWLPALLRPGLVLVIAPLRSLMRDQRLTLLKCGIATAEFINSDVDEVTRRAIIEEARLGYVRLLYISPERLRMKTFLDQLDWLKEFVPVSILAVDEAHCISEWGHDFRPSYLKLPDLHKVLAKDNAGLRLVALTATAGKEVQADMLGVLTLGDGDVVKEEVADRERFSYQIVVARDLPSKDRNYREILTKHVPKALRKASLAALMQQRNQRHEKSLGVVFCIYADPHGKHTVEEGVPHYLSETMRIFEPNAPFQRHAFGTGAVRAFSSKAPTLCPHCDSYAYTSKTPAIADDDDDDAVDGEEPIDDQDKDSAKTKGVKVCHHCNREFDGKTAVTPPAWNELIKANQNDFKNSQFDILVATKGFGMGIDKSSVRFVVHTSLSSGMESWYQEVGRAGRDNERAHIVLLTTPPNEKCREQLNQLEIKRPACNSYRAGCPHGMDGLCDYGKQHMFIARSYPGAESDAVSALRVLDKLIVARKASHSTSIPFASSNKVLSHHELALRRLFVLGLVDDYIVSYGRAPRFDVEFALPELPDHAEALAGLEKQMQQRLVHHLSHFSSRPGRPVAQELARCRQEYRGLEKFESKLRQFAGYGEVVELFEQTTVALYRSIYEHLLLLLDHTYTDVVKMRYEMLGNLLAIVTDQKCRRINILGYFGEAVEDSYRCGSCDVCAPNLEFPEIRIAPAKTSNAEKELQLRNALANDSFDLAVLTGLVKDFSEYPTAKYRQARAVLEGNANNLTALFLAREFSPPAELAANSRRLLRTANQRSLPLSEVEKLLQSSKHELKPGLLALLNEIDTACDSPEGWKFLVKESSKAEYRRNQDVSLMRECLQFFLLVEETLPDRTRSLAAKARLLKEVFDA